MKKLTSLRTFVLGTFATLTLALGLNSLAYKLDPVAQKSRVATEIEVADGGSIPCAACSVPDRSDRGSAKLVA